METTVASRGRWIYQAKLAEISERYNDMVAYMNVVVKNSSPTSELTTDERNLFSVAYKNVVLPLRDAWRTVKDTEQKVDNPARSTLAKAYRSSVIESELSCVCNSLINLVDTHLLPSASTSESKVFYLKMKGDYHRYLAECSTGDDRSKAADDALLSYNTALVIAREELTPTNPTRLGLSLNFSVLYYEIFNSVGIACSMAKEAFEMALSELELQSSEEESYKDSPLILQLLRQNITRWTEDMQEKINMNNDAQQMG